MDGRRYELHDFGNRKPSIVIQSLDQAFNPRLSRSLKGGGTSYDGRALVMGRYTSDRMNDIIVIRIPDDRQTLAPLEQNLTEQELLTEQGILDPRVNVMRIAKRPDQAWSDTLDFKELVRRVKKNGVTQVYHYSGMCPVSTALAEALGLPTFGSNGKAKDIEDKSWMLKAIEGGFSPRGKFAYSVESALRRFDEVLRNPGSSGIAVIKPILSASGVGLVRATAATRASLEAYLIDLPKDEVEGGFTICEWLPHDESFSVLFYVGKHSIDRVALTEQLFEKDQVTHAGNEVIANGNGSFFMHHKMAERLWAETYVYAKRAQEERYEGYFGSDVVPLPENHESGCWFAVTDINARVVSTVYGVEAAQKLGCLWVMSRNFEIPEGVSFEEIITYARKINALMMPGFDYGLGVYNTRLAVGAATALLFARNPMDRDKAIAQYKKVRNWVRQRSVNYLRSLREHPASEKSASKPSAQESPAIPTMAAKKAAGVR